MSLQVAAAETRRTAVEPPMLVVVGAEVWRTWTAATSDHTAGTWAAVTAEIHEWLSAAAARRFSP